MRNNSGVSDSLKNRNGQWLKNHTRLHPEGQMILIAEDSEADIYFLFRVMQQAGIANPIFVVRDGDEAAAYLKGTGRSQDRNEFPVPHIVFLDLKMPGPDGFEILRLRQTEPHLADCLFVAVSTYSGVYQINLAYECGADTFLSKPLSSEDVLNVITSFQTHWELIRNRRGKAKS